MPRCPKCGDELPEDAHFCPKDGEPLPVLVGRVLDGRYRVDALMAAGGVGAVYRGRHLTLDSPVAVKVLRGTFATLPEFVERFEREAKALSAIRHVNVVAVSDFGVDRTIPYIVMELLDGAALHEEIRVLGRIPQDRAVAIARQVLAALTFAHAAGVIHRDLKPSNVMLIEQPGVGEVAKILDFGLAKFVEGPERGSRGEPLTRSGTVFGTPAYMAPEQAAGKDADARSDIYACGVMLYEMLVGRRPFHGSSGPELTRRRLLEPPEPPREAAPDAGISPAVEAVVLRALRKPASERYQTADEMSRALAEALGRSPAEPSVPPVSGRSEAARSAQPSPLGVEATIPADSVESLETVAAAPAAPGPAREPDVETRVDRPSPRDSSPVDGPRPKAPPRRRNAVYAAAVFGVLLLAVAAVVIARSVTRGPLPDAAPLPQDAAPAEDVAPPTDAPAPEVDAGRDPLAEPLPEDLEWLRKSIEGPSRSRQERRRRHDVSREFRDDPRLHLILGHNLSRKAWVSDALDRYENAVTLDPGVRGDPLLREYLLDALAARREAIAERAFTLVQRTYGDDTLDVLLWGAYDHPRQPAADAAVAAIDRLEMRARLDPVLHGIGDVRRSVPCRERRDALDRLRGRRDPRIARALEALRDGDPEAARCLGDLLDRVIRESGATGP